MEDEFSVPARLGMKAFLARRWAVFIVAYVGYSACYFVRNNLVVVSDIMTKELGWSAVAIGSILTGFAISYGLGKLIMGVIVDHLRLRHSFAGALAISALLCILMSFQRDPAVFFLFLLAIGLVQGACAPAALATIGAWYPAFQRGSRIGVWNTSQNVGAGTLAVIISASLAFAGPSQWHIAFWLPGLIALACSGLIFFVGGDRPWQEGMPTLKELYGSRALPEVQVPADVSYWRLVRVHVVGNRTLLLLATLNTLLYVLRFGILSWIPIFGSDVHAMSPHQSSVVITMFEWGAVPGALIFAWIALRHPWRVTIPAAVGIAVLSLLILAYAFAGTPVSVAALALPMGALIYGPQIIINVLTVQFVSPRAVGVAIGWVGLGGYLVGAALANLSLPRIAESIGWTSGTVGLSVVGLACVFICIRLRRAERNAAV